MQAAQKHKTQSLRFDDGAVQFRQRIVVSLLSHKPLLIRNIRSNDLQHPGLKDYEACFLRLIDKMTNGTKLEINSTGTQLRFKPGTLLGGSLTHECPPSRSIGWFVEGILPLAPFGKEALELEPSLSMPAAIKQANEMMGLASQGPLPSQADALLSALGL